MCMTVPGKIIEIKKNNVKIDYGSERKKARIIEGEYKVGDYVIVQNSIVIEKVPVEQMAKWLEMLKNGGADGGEE